MWTSGVSSPIGTWLLQPWAGPMAFLGHHLPSTARSKVNLMALKILLARRVSDSASCVVFALGPFSVQAGGVMTAARSAEVPTSTWVTLALV